MLYSRSDSFDVEVIPLENPFVIPNDADYVHFHWIQTLWKYSGETREDFLSHSYGNLFLNWEQLKPQTKFIWSCHDGLSFAEDSYLEIPLIAELTKRVDVIHILTKHTIGLLEKHATLDDSKIILIPHSSFEGVLNRIDGNKSDVRREFGIPMDATVIGFLGQIRNYKGLGTLLLAFDELIYNFPNLFLLIAGNNWLKESINLDTLGAITERFLLVNEFLTDTEYSKFASTIDIAVYPYERILNSGSLASSATMGHHVILPNFPELNFYPPLEFCSYFDPGNHVDLARVIGEVVETKTYESSREKAIIYSKNNSPEIMSQNFFTELMSVRK